MKKGINLLIFVIFFFFASYIWMLSPGKSEKEGDAFYENKEYERASLLYMSALSSDSYEMQKERLLFKSANALRLSGQKERALSFYIKLLRDFPGSVYKDRIGEILKNDHQQDVAMSSLENVKLDLSFLKQDNHELQIMDLKKKRDQIYLLILQMMNREGVRPDFEFRDLYQAYTKTQESYEKKTAKTLMNLELKSLKNLKRKLALISFPKEFSEELKKKEPVFHLENRNFEDFSSLQIEKSWIPDGIFINLNGISHTNLAINVERMLEFFEKSKLFLVFDDIEDSSFPEVNVENPRLHIVKRDKERHLGNQISEILHISSIWQ